VFRILRIYQFRYRRIQCWGSGSVITRYGSAILAESFFGENADPDPKNILILIEIWVRKNRLTSGSVLIFYGFRSVYSISFRSGSIHSIALGYGSYIRIQVSNFKLHPFAKKKKCCRNGSRSRRICNLIAFRNRSRITNYSSGSGSYVFFIKDLKRYKIKFKRNCQCCGSGMFIPDPDFYPSRIPDPKTATKERDEKKFVVIIFYVATNFSKLQIIWVLKCWRKKFGPIFKEL